MSRVVAAVCVLAGCFTVVSGCTGIPTSPYSGPATPLPESIEFTSANAPSGTTIKMTWCSDNWDIYSCFKDLRLTFSVRLNRNSELAIFDAEFLTSQGRVCAVSGAAPQPLFAGVSATFRTTDVYLASNDCFARLPFQTTRVLIRVSDIPNPSVNTVGAKTPIELLRQEFSLGYTFVHE